MHFAPPGLVLGERLGRCARILEIDIGELLPAGVFHDKGGADVLDRPGRREAARETFLGDGDRPPRKWLPHYGFCRLRCPPDQSQNKEQDDCADEGVDDCSNNAGTDYNAKLR